MMIAHALTLVLIGMSLNSLVKAELDFEVGEVDPGMMAKVSAELDHLPDTPDGNGIDDGLTGVLSRIKRQDVETNDPNCRGITFQSSVWWAARSVRLSGGATSQNFRNCIYNTVTAITAVVVGSGCCPSTCYNSANMYGVVCKTWYNTSANWSQTRDAVYQALIQRMSVYSG